MEKLDMKMTPFKKFDNRSPLRGLLLIALVLTCFGLSPRAQAVCQEGCLTSENTVLGEDALLSDTGHSNTAIGFQALFSNTTGIENTANGYNALFSNTNGRLNTAIGLEALFSNTSGASNTANGLEALFSNTTGASNTSVGYNALLNNT